MDTHFKKINWHFEALPTKTMRAFEYLSKQKWLEKSGWYLAGGTALALQVGYRQSVDLDFFTEDASEKVNNTQVLEHLKKSGKWFTDIEKEGTIYGELQQAKISFIAYPFFKPAQPFLRYGTISILSQEDIAVMKIIAISQRGRKRDFFDLYYSANHILSLEKAMRRLKKQYPTVAHDYYHILKSLIYFADAEGDPEPNLLVGLDWKTVKSYFETEIPALTKKLLRI